MIRGVWNEGSRVRLFARPWRGILLSRSLPLRSTWPTARSACPPMALPNVPLGSTMGAFSGSSLSLDSDSATFSCRASSLSTPITMFDGDSSSKTPGCASSNWRGFQLLDLLGKSLLFTNLFWRVQGLQIHHLRHDLLFRNDL